MIQFIYLDPLILYSAIAKIILDKNPYFSYFYACGYSRFKKMIKIKTTPYFEKRIGAFSPFLSYYQKILSKKI